jgi:UDP-GlcNAc3NAcA epimerase
LRRRVRNGWHFNVREVERSSEAQRHRNDCVLLHTDLMKLLSIVGARPQFIKIAPLARAFEHPNGRSATVEHVIVHTGQHYNAEMSDIFFHELKIPEPSINLAIGSGRHGSQTGRMLDKIEEVLLEQDVDLVVVYGDTNSTLAGALAAAKLQIPVAHVEAGLRSFNRRMPEEINRVIADHVSDLLLAPTPTAMENLRIEGLASKAVFTGDIMYDAVIFNRDLAKQASVTAKRLGLSAGAYGVVTLHRAENTATPGILRELLMVFNDIATTLPLVFPVHPRAAKQFAIYLADAWHHPSLHMIDPVGYLDMLSLIANARVLFTDSGGLQKEAFFLGCPTITVREETEWIETVQAGANIVAGIDPNRIRAARTNWETRLSSGKPDFSAKVATSFGDGHAAEKIRAALLSFHKTHKEED